MGKRIENLILRIAHGILKKRGGFVRLSKEQYINTMPADFYDWVYSTGYCLWLKEESRKRNANGSISVIDSKEKHKTDGISVSSFQ